MKRGNKKKTSMYLFLRYLILILIGIFLSLFYKILLSLTILPSSFLLNIFYDVSVIGNFILVEGIIIEIINACVAGSAYYLLLILNLTTSMKEKQRTYSLIFSFASLFILNILRIVFLTALYLSNSTFFDFTHQLFWYVLSIFFVVGIWFLTIKLFKIKKIPVYSDIKFLKSL
jgi:exosortase/archaeosortase family protein